MGVEESGGEGWEWRRGVGMGRSGREPLQVWIDEVMLVSQ